MRQDNDAPPIRNLASSNVSAEEIREAMERASSEAREMFPQPTSEQMSAIIGGGPPIVARRNYLEDTTEAIHKLAQRLIEEDTFSSYSHLPDGTPVYIQVGEYERDTAKTKAIERMIDAVRKETIERCAKIAHEKSGTTSFVIERDIRALYEEMKL